MAHHFACLACLPVGRLNSAVRSSMRAWR